MNRDGVSNLESLVPSQPRESTTKPEWAASSPSRTTMHVTALDGIVNLNALFTSAVFIGLSMTSPSGDHVGNSAICSAPVEVVRGLIIYEVISFGAFLFSSFIALSLKFTISLASSSPNSNPQHGEINSWIAILGLFGSAVGSILGCLFLLLSMVNFVEVKLGMLSCSREAATTVYILIVSVGSSLLAYIFTAVYASFFV